MSTEDMSFDIEDPKLNEYISKRVKKEMEQFKLNKVSDVLAPKQKMFSTENVDRFVQMLKQNESFEKYLFSFFQQNIKVPHPVQSNQDNPAPPKQQIKTKKKRSKSLSPVLTGITSSGSKDTLEEDLYSIMMMTKALSLEWFLGFLSFSIQVLLASIIIYEQTQTEFFGTQMSIPIRVPPLTRVTQVLSVILALMTQNEFLSGLGTIFMFPFVNKQKWGKICDIESHDCTRRMWLLRILLPNAMKAIQGIMILVASFIVIVQLTSTVDVLKDYSALFVVSSVDNFFFDFAEKGYFGEKVRANAGKVKDTEFDEIGVNKTLRALFYILIGIFVSAWVSIFAQQVQGVYVKQMYPLCDHGAKFNNTQKSFLNIIGDTRCQFPQGEGTNIMECGWDGGDCEIINDRYPQCDVNDFTLLGDGKCDHGAYNSKDCGFDNGDCVEFNEEQSVKYKNCTTIVPNIGWIGDGTCNGGAYASDECDNDGGDCSNCTVADMDLIGDGKCDTGAYNTKECSYDGGDCVEVNRKKEKQYENCSVSNIGWIGDGVCDGVDYMTIECGMDEGDCDACIEYLVPENIEFWLLMDYYYDTDASKLGDGVCDGFVYNTEVCGFDAGDCVLNNTNLQQQYPECLVQNPSWIGDGFCLGGEYNTEQCGFDGGDCIEFNTNYPDCKVLLAGFVGDGDCDEGWEEGINTPECKFDGGDCTDTNCTAEILEYVGDGFCDGGLYLTEDCNFDDGDCDDCHVADLTLIGNGVCDGREYNTFQCGYDGGDCFERNELIQKKYSRCVVENIGWIKDGICDGIEYATEECGRDGGDCRNSCEMMNETLFGDGFCDEINNVDGCTFDGNDCVPSMKLIGDKYDSVWKWSGGVVGHDGNIYGIPEDMNKMLRIDPSPNATNPTALVGDALGDERGKWDFGVVGNDGIIYGVPYSAKSILSYNPTSEETKLIAENHPLLESSGKFTGGVLAKNGMIYFIPLGYNKVIRFDPSNLEDPLTEIGDDLGDNCCKMRGGVLGSDGNIYGIPYFENRVLKIDVTNDSTSFIGHDYPDKWKWYNGVLAKDGNIYACPNHANQILQINIQSQTTNLVGPDLGDDENMWGGFVEGEDGFLYGMPIHSNELLRFDPIKHTATLIPLPEEMHRGWKWMGGARAENGVIYVIPYGVDQVLSIEPLKFRP